MTSTQLRAKIPELGVRVRMGQMWAGFYILCFCFIVLFNSHASCDSLRRLGPPEGGISTQNFVRGSGDVETEKLLRAAETSLRVGKGIGSVKEYNIRLGIRSSKTTGLDDRGLGQVYGRFLGENVTRIENRGGAVIASKKRKRLGIDRKENTYVKQSFVKGKGVQNYKTQKEIKGIRSNGAHDAFKSQDEQSEVNRAQSGVNSGKQENPNTAMPDSKMNPSETEGKLKGNELRTRVNVKRPVANLTKIKVNREEEETQISAIEVSKEKKNGGDSEEEYERKGLQNGVKGKRAVSKSIRKVVNEEEGGPYAAIQENKKKNSGSNSGEEYGRKGLQNGVKGKGSVSKLIPKVEKEEEENPTAAIQENAEKKSGGDSEEEEYKRKGWQNEVKGKGLVSKWIPKIEKEEGDPIAAIQESAEREHGGDSEEEYKRKGLQNEVKGKRSISKSIRKDEKEDEEEEEDTTAAIQENKEKNGGGDSEEKYKRKELHNEVKGKRPISKSIRKDEKEEEEEDTMAAIQENKEKNSGGDSEEDYKGKRSQNKVKGKMPVSKSIHKDEKKEEEGPNAASQEKNSRGDSEEEYKKKELQNEVKGKRRVSKSTHKEEKGGGNSIALIPKSKEKEDTPDTVDSEEDSKRNELQAQVKEENSTLQLVGNFEKNVNDDGLELAEEFLSPDDQSAPENLVSIKVNEDFREETGRETQDLKADQVELDQTVSDKQTKRDKRRDKGMPTQMPELISAEESTEREIKDDDIKSRTTSKYPQTEEDSAYESVNSGAKEDNQYKTDQTHKQSKSNIRNPEEENADESADNGVEEDNESETVATNKQLISRFPNPKEDSADESEDNDVDEGNASKRVSAKKQSKSKFSDPEKENADESEDNDIKVENESETVPINKQLKSNLLNLEEENPDEFLVSDVNEDNEIETFPTNKKSKSDFPNSEEDNADESEAVPKHRQSKSDFSLQGDDNADESAGNAVKEDDESEAVSKHKKSKSDSPLQGEDNADESVNGDGKSEAESEIIVVDKKSSSLDTEESSANSTYPGEVSEEEYSDFIQEIQDLPSKFQDTAGKVADKLMPEIHKFSNKSKIYFNRANEEITEGFRPLIGNKYAPFFASVISYIFVLLPLIVVIVLFDQIRTYFPLQKAILYANIYLAAYFATLMFASFLIGMEPMKFFFRNSLTGYIYLQLLEALGYILYLLLQFLNLITSFSKGPISAKLAALLQCGVSIFIGLHYYVTVFHRAMAQKAPHTSWKIQAGYTIVFFVLCLFSKIKYGKKEYIQEQYGSSTTKKN